MIVVRIYGERGEQLQYEPEAREAAVSPSVAH
jgi:hypothetical protein